MSLPFISFSEDCDFKIFSWVDLNLNEFKTHFVLNFISCYQNLIFVLILHYLFGVG